MYSRIKYNDKVEKSWGYRNMRPDIMIKTRKAKCTKKCVKKEKINFKDYKVCLNAVEIKIKWQY